MRILSVLTNVMKKPHKIRYYSRKMFGKYAWRIGNGGWAPLPSTIKLYINTRCNARCSMCDIGTQSDTMFSRLCTNDVGDMSLALFNKILAEVRPFASIINFAGVEPLLHHDSITMLKMAKENGFRVVLTTNGLLLPKYAADIYHLAIDSLQVSLDGPEDIHDHVRGVPGAYTAVVEGLKTIRDLKAGKDGLHVQINCCINDTNFMHLSTLLDFVLSEKLADYVAFIHPFFVTEEAAAEFNAEYSHLGVATQAELLYEQLMRIDTKVLFEELVTINNIYAYYGIEWKSRFTTLEQVERYYHHPEQQMNNKWCKVPWTVGMIFSNGDCGILNRCIPYITGNIEEATFREIWYGEKYKTFRRALKRSRGFSVCKRCCGVV